MIHVLVADNRSIRLFEARPPQCRLEELAIFRNLALGKHERDLQSDRPGRVVGGVSGVHHSYEPSTRPSEHVRQHWFRSVGPSLQSFLADRRSDALVLVAAPRVLSFLREGLPATLRRRVAAEVRLDLGRHPPSALTRRLLPTLRTVLRKSLPARSASAASTGSMRSGYRVLD